MLHESRVRYRASKTSVHPDAAIQHIPIPWSPEKHFLDSQAIKVDINFSQEW